MGQEIDVFDPPKKDLRTPTGRQSEGNMSDGGPEHFFGPTDPSPPKPIPKRPQPATLGVRTAPYGRFWSTWITHLAKLLPPKNVGKN